MDKIIEKKQFLIANGKVREFPEVQAVRLLQMENNGGWKLATTEEIANHKNPKNGINDSEDTGNPKGKASK